MGYTPQKIYEICGCIREHFCLSYNIRKNNNLYIYFVTEDFSVKFIGEELKYLGPDERSQALLLNKAINKREVSLNSLDKHWINSTPGIYAKKFVSFDRFIEELSNLIRKRFHIIINRIGKFEKYLDVDYKDLTKENIESESLITIFLNENFPMTILMDILKDFNDPVILYLPKIREAQNKVLYINFLLEN
jgi:hypothetical protein